VARESVRVRAPLGPRSGSGREVVQASWSGRCAWQTLRPCWMRLTCASYIWSGFEHAQEQVVGVVGGDLRSDEAHPLATARRGGRRASTAGRMEKSSSTEAVFLPMPSMVTSQSRAPRAVISPRNSKRVVAALLPDPAQGRLEARRLLIGEAAQDRMVSTSSGSGAYSIARPIRRPRRRGAPPPPQPAPGLWASTSPPPG